MICFEELILRKENMIDKVDKKNKKENGDIEILSTCSYKLQ